MPLANSNGLEIFYDVFGGSTAPPVVLIMGLGSQMIRWHEGFCRGLSEEGFFVIRFDNRDVGLSTKIEAAGMPRFGPGFIAPYTLSDMARDVTGLLDALSLSSAHVAGLSMGGMIAQTLALEAPERVKSLVSMESTTGDPGLPPPEPEAMKALTAVPPADRDGYVEHMARVFRIFSGGSPAFDEAMERERAAQSFERSAYPVGTARQMAAILASGSREKALAAVRAPALVIHGDHDTLIPPAHGEATARALSGARLVPVPGLGHGLSYPSLWPSMIRELADFFRAAR